MQLEQLMFQSTYLYKVRPSSPWSGLYLFNFNPRTYIKCIKATYLAYHFDRFQSTYLYKVRHYRLTNTDGHAGFNPHYYIRAISKESFFIQICNCFNRTYIRYDISHLLIGCYLEVFQSTYLYKVRREPPSDF